MKHEIMTDRPGTRHDIMGATDHMEQSVLRRSGTNGENGDQARGIKHSMANTGWNRSCKR